MKIIVHIKNDYHQGLFRKGDVGFIDGYVRGANNIPCAVVCVKEELDLVPLTVLRVMKSRKDQ